MGGKSHRDCKAEALQKRKCAGRVIANAQPGLCRRGNMARQGVMVMGSSRELSRSLASTGMRSDRVIGRARSGPCQHGNSLAECAQIFMGVLLEAAWYSYLFLAQLSLDGGRSRKPKHQRSDQWAPILAEKLGLGLTNSRKKSSCQGRLASTSEPVSLRRWRCWAYRSELERQPGPILKTLRASEVELQILVVAGGSVASPRCSPVMSTQLGLRRAGARSCQAQRCPK